MHLFLQVAQLQGLSYVIAAVLFIVGLKWMSAPAKARLGNCLSSLGMLLVIVVALLSSGLDYYWIAIGLVIGSLIGVIAAMRVSMIGMPGMVALFNGSGGLASLLLGACEFIIQGHHVNYAGFTAFVTVSAILIGGIAFTGSIVAWGKLSGVMSAKPWVYRGQQVVNLLLLFVTIVLSVLYIRHPMGALPVDLSGIALSNSLLLQPVFLSLVLLSLVLGVFLVMPIGGADMPVAISLLNSYSGLAACAAGYVVGNDILIVAGALVGMSGIVLTNVMCKAMNRSLGHVLFSGFGKVAVGGGHSQTQQAVRSITPEDAYYVLEAATNVVIVPGFGMAVAGAQHAVSTLTEVLQKNGATVRFAIHPVAGRMPGHMNVLLAEASIPYDDLVEMDDINPQMGQIDVCIVIGANDVVNTSARDDADSPIAGMPIIEADLAKSVFVLKRSMSPGFSGLDNPLFNHENTRLIFGDAKATIESLIESFK